MELIGKIHQKINNSSGYILGQDNRLYLYFCYDFLEDFADDIGQKVFFRAEGGRILRATYISKFNTDDLQDTC